jgi:hypothetical protein
MSAVAPRRVATAVALADRFLAGVFDLDDPGRNAGLVLGVCAITVGEYGAQSTLAVSLLARGFFDHDGGVSVFGFHLKIQIPLR